MKLYPTKTGENTLYIPELDETYHSRDGAISEALHVFIIEGLQRNFQHGEVTNILEIGFGTGLNALVTAIEAEKEQKKIHYITLEPFPIDQELIAQLDYGKFVNNQELYAKIHGLPWQSDCTVSPYFTLKKLQDKIEHVALASDQFHVVFFDAFGPKKQEELWEASVFSKLHNLMKKDGVLVTYSAAGHLKRKLKALNFKLFHPPGANGKREMTVAIKR